MYPTGVLVEPVSKSSFESGLRGEYFSNRELKGEPVLVRTDEGVNFEWGALSPDPKVPENNFSVRWTGKLKAPESGKYLIGMAGNGGARLVVDGQIIVEELTNRRTRTVTKEMTLEAGRSYDVRIEYLENNNEFSAAKLVWGPPSAANILKAEALDKVRQSDAVVMVMGITPSIEGEEMDVQVPGFRGGDRTEIALPEPQEELIKEVQALGKPVVLVLLGGSALAVNWANDNVPAILDAWYPGEEGGTAIADVIFGDYNPAGRLPVTFYRSIADLPPFTDYSMKNRTYRYFRGEPLYPFGFGLSYSTFKYSKLQLAPARARVGSPVNVSVEVQNTGQVAGDEVVQVYLTDVGATYPVPIRSLVGIKRVALKPGETRKLSFTISPEQMSVVDDVGKRLIEPGEFELTVGGKQPGFKGNADARTTDVVTGRFELTGKTRPYTP
jgi:beta-glucosidase